MISKWLQKGRQSIHNYCDLTKFFGVTDSCNISWSRLRVERKGDTVVWRIFPCMFLDDSIFLVCLFCRSVCDCFRSGTKYPFWSTLFSHCSSNQQNSDRFDPFPSKDWQKSMRTWMMSSRVCPKKLTTSFPWRCQALGPWGQGMMIIAYSLYQFPYKTERTAKKKRKKCQLPLPIWKTDLR